mmetsp:Transcript_20541/g.49400  ORF Transcript_20541/g.49400 Transcript_20541/m.49400 type:complete len:310 (-) Transcript_20541:699-1628(-)
MSMEVVNMISSGVRDNDDDSDRKDRRRYEDNLLLLLLVEGAASAFCSSSRTITATPSLPPPSPSHPSRASVVIAADDTTPLHIVRRVTSSHALSFDMLSNRSEWYSTIVDDTSYRRTGRSDDDDDATCGPAVGMGAMIPTSSSVAGAGVIRDGGTTAAGEGVGGRVVGRMLSMVGADVVPPPPELSSISSPPSYGFGNARSNGFGNARSNGFDVVCATVGDGVVAAVVAGRVGFLDGGEVVGRGVVGRLEGGAVVGLSVTIIVGTITPLYETKPHSLRSSSNVRTKYSVNSIPSHPTPDPSRNITVYPT